MRIRIRVILASLSICLIQNTTLPAQKPPLKWGKITPEEWALKEVSYDTSAAAVILCDYGRAQFLGSKLMIDVHRRIKLLKKEGLRQSDIRIPFYSHDKIQNIINLKARTYNHRNGKTEIHEVGKDQIFEQDYLDEWSFKQFTFPDIEVGSIIEYSYTLASESVLYLKSWDFQNEIPTLHSEFRAVIPTYLDYIVIFQGPRMLSQYSETPKNQWFLKNVLAIKKEPYMTTLEDYREKIRFQLSGYYEKSSYQASGPSYRSLMTDWPNLGKELRTSIYFGGQLSQRGLAKDILSKLDLEGKTRLEQLKEIYKFVQLNFNWNKEYSRMAYQELKRTNESREGSSAEINLILCLLLKNAGIKADPVLISTRDHGMMTKVYPLLSQFNHVIVRALVNEEEFFLDGTDPWRPFDLLAEADLNYLGLLVPGDSDPQWLTVAPGKSNYRNIHLTIDLQDSQKPVARFSGSMNGYYALDARKKIDAGDDQVIPVTQVNVQYPLEIENVKQLDEPLTVKSADFSIETINNQELIYLQPVLFNYYSENPFKSESRSYPVDFASPFSELYAIDVLLPEGYTVEEIPQGSHIKLPNDYGFFQYFAEQQDDRIKFMIKVSINKPDIGAGLYGSLKEFYNLVVSKLNAQLVLRRDQN